MLVNCNGKLLSLEKPKVMGILNLTPDSFSDGGLYNTEKAALQHVEEMLEEGADIIDIGGYSSRPGAIDISEQEEIMRIKGITQQILKHFPQALISIDTFRSNVAQTMLDEGVHLINDISGGTLDANMMKTVSAYNVPYILMHIRGNPQNMQKLTHYENIIHELWVYFQEKISFAKSLGIKDIILDVGFGFGKDVGANYYLLKQLDTFHLFGCPLLVGVSRKSMIYKLLSLPPLDILPYTTALHLKALENGANVLRVHEVKEAKNVIKLFEIIKNSDN